MHILIPAVFPPTHAPPPPAPAHLELYRGATAKPGLGELYDYEELKSKGWRGGGRSQFP